jgi:hypothetical protein
MHLEGAVGASGSVPGVVAELAVLLIAAVFVLLVRAVGAAGTESGVVAVAALAHANIITTRAVAGA